MIEKFKLLLQKYRHFILYGLNEYSNITVQNQQF